jgi:hypothetical protein
MDQLVVCREAGEEECRSRNYLVGYLLTLYYRNGKERFLDSFALI